MRYFLYILFFCATAISAFAISLPAPTNLTVTAMRNADGRQYFHLTFTDSAVINDSLSYYRIQRWRGAVPDTTERTYIVGMRATSSQTQSYDDTSSLFNPSTYDSNFATVYSYAVYLEEYVQHPTDSLYANYSPLSDIVSGTLDSVYLYFTSTPSSSISEALHDTMNFTFTAKESAGNSTIIYSVYSSNSSVANAGIDSSNGNFYCIAAGYGSASITVKAKDAVGRACYYTFSFSVPHPYDTVTVTLKDQSTGTVIAGGTRDYWRLFTPGDSGHETAFSSGTTLLNSTGSFIILFPDSYKLNLRASAEGYGAAWATDSLGDKISIVNGGSYTIDLPSATSHTISGTVTDTTTNKPIDGARMVFIRVTANDGYIGIDTVYTDSTGDYQFSYTEGDSLVGTEWIRVFTYASGYADSMQYTTFLSSFEDHTGVNFHFGSYHSSSDTSQYFHIVPATGDTTADAIHTLTYVTIYKLVDTGAVVYSRDTTDRGYVPINLYTGKYIIFAQPDTGYQSGYYSKSGYAATWTQADTLVVPVANHPLNSAFTIFVILQPDSSVALQGSGAHIDGIVYNQSGGIAPSAHLLLYQQISAPAGGNASRLLYTTTTDSLGDYSFAKVPPGTYMVLVDIVGKPVFESQVITIGGETDSLAFNITYNPNAVNEGEQIPVQSYLAQNYPNPFSQGTDIAFTISDASASITLTVYDEAGKVIGTAAQGTYAQGAHTIHVDASALPAGVHAYVLRVNGQVWMRQMIVVK
ncbi:MAG TPA: T9SS type A sorting domain-containing protein [Candidatus Kapabacteria bacterium]|nr:T9SS type A sorting domain-containing protein [Candidatus Kapabacteria bacterium]